MAAVDLQWLASFILEAGIGVTAYRICKALEKRQDTTEAKLENHEVRIIVLERAT